MARSPSSAPRGAVSIARQVAREVQRSGAAAAAARYSVTPDYARRIAHASRTGTIGRLWRSDRAVSSWRDRLAGRGRPSAPRGPRPVGPAPTKIGQRVQKIWQEIGNYRDKDIAQALGISRQRATAERLRIERGDIPRGAGRGELERAQDILAKLQATTPYTVDLGDGRLILVVPDPEQWSQAVDHYSKSFSHLYDALQHAQEVGIERIAALVQVEPGAWRYAIAANDDGSRRKNRRVSPAVVIPDDLQSLSLDDISPDIPAGRP